HEGLPVPPGAGPHPGRRAVRRRAGPAHLGPRLRPSVQPASARRADQRSRSGDARSLARAAGRAPRHGAAGQPRPRFPRPRGDVHHRHRRQRPLGRVCRRYTDMLAQRAEESRGSPPPKTRNTKRSRPATQTSELPGSLPRRMNFNDRRALDLLPARIAALEARLTELNAVLADPDLYRRDPARFRDTTDALAVARDELAAAEDQWA